MATQASMTSPRLIDRLKFFAEFLRSPFAVGSPIATSSRTIRHMLANLDWRTARCVVEYGPGAGEFTRAILAQLPQAAKLIAIESEEALADHLRDAIEDDRLTVHCDSAESARAILEINGEGQVDYILSGIPFSSLEPQQCEQIARDAAKMLRPGGQFLAYQVSQSIERYLHANFRTVKHRRTWLNLPPYHLYWCSNAEAASTRA